MRKDRVMVGSVEVVLAQDRLTPSDWRVEYFDSDGRCYVAVGQIATVLQLPAQPKTESEAKEQERVAVAG